LCTLLGTSVYTRRLVYIRGCLGCLPLAPSLSPLQEATTIYTAYTSKRQCMHPSVYTRLRYRSAPLHQSRACACAGAYRSTRAAKAPWTRATQPQSPSTETEGKRRGRGPPKAQGPSSSALFPSIRTRLRNHWPRAPRPPSHSPSSPPFGCRSISVNKGSKGSVDKGHPLSTRAYSILCRHL
jgi:hypothetical protein